MVYRKFQYEYIYIFFNLIWFIAFKKHTFQITTKGCKNLNLQKIKRKYFIIMQWGSGSKALRGIRVLVGAHLVRMKTS